MATNYSPYTTLLVAAEATVVRRVSPRVVVLNYECEVLREIVVFLVHGARALQLMRHLARTP